LNTERLYAAIEPHNTLHERVNALRETTNSAEQFVNRAPQSKRLATERQALLDAITTRTTVSIEGRSTKTMAYTH